MYFARRGGFLLRANSARRGLLSATSVPISKIDTILTAEFARNRAFSQRFLGSTVPRFFARPLKLLAIVVWRIVQRPAPFFKRLQILQTLLRQCHQFELEVRDRSGDSSENLAPRRMAAFSLEFTELDETDGVVIDHSENLLVCRGRGPGKRAVRFEKHALQFHKPLLGVVETRRERSAIATVQVKVKLAQRDSARIMEVILASWSIVPRLPTSVEGVL